MSATVTRPNSNAAKRPTSRLIVRPPLLQVERVYLAAILADPLKAESGTASKETDYAIMPDALGLSLDTAWVFHAAEGVVQRGAAPTRRREFGALT